MTDLAEDTSGTSD